MTTNRKLNAKKTLKAIDETIDLLSGFDEPVLDELQRVSRIGVGVDGWRAGQGKGSGGTDISDPTGQAVIARQGRIMGDPRGEAIEAVVKHLAEARRSAIRASRALAVFHNLGESERGRVVSIGECKACAELVPGSQNNRLKAGYCPACYSAWRRSADANGARLPHHIFEKERRVALTEASGEAESKVAA